MTENAIKANTKMSIGEELARILISMSDKDKEIAFAMIQGMVAGKQIAEQQKSA